jgi:hypothetical protein
MTPEARSPRRTASGFPLKKRKGPRKYFREQRLQHVQGFSGVTGKQYWLVIGRTPSIGLAGAAVLFPRGILAKFPVS